MSGDEKIVLGAVLRWQDFGKICRGCLSAAESLANIAEIQSPGKDFYQIFNQLTSLGITPEDGLPQTLCEKCIRDIVQMYSLKTKLMHSDSVLKNIYADYVKYILHFDLMSVDDKSWFEEPDDSESKCGLSEVMVDLENEPQIIRSEESKEKTIEYYRCSCQTFFASYTDYMKHLEETEHEPIKSKKEYKCYCEATFDNYTEFINHRKEAQHTQRKDRIHAPKEYKCSCEIIFTSYGEYVKHRKETQHKSPNRLHLCPICGKSVKVKQLSAHISSHTLKYDCKTCNRKFSNISSLKRHIKIHTGEKPHICEYCGKGFIQKTLLVEHRLVHHVGEPLKCDKCGYTSHGPVNYKRHFKRCQRMDDPRYKRYTPRKHQCQICKRKMASQDSLQAHILTHDGKQLAGKLSEKEIADIVIHQVERPFACEVCGKTFKTAATLKTHSSIHMNENPYTCKYCSKRCNQLQHLTMHLRQHTGERPYNCQYCDKTFVALSSYKAHVRTHTGERPYNCDQCTKAFYDSSSLWKHRRKFHVESHKNSS